MSKEKPQTDPLSAVSRMLNVGTPLVVVDSHDHPHTIQRLRKIISKRTRPVIIWNVADGFEPLTDEGEEAINSLDPAELKKALQSGPHGALHIAKKLPPETILVFENLHWFWDQAIVKQTLLNLREPFKATNRAVIAMTLGATLPTDLIQSVSFVEDPLPTEEILSEKVQSVYKSALGEDATLDTDEAANIARELRGTSPFRAEQLTAQSLTKSGVNRDRLRDNARKQINDTPGLSVESSTETFDDIGGLDAIREFLGRYFGGPRKPSVVVRIEEIEKALAGVGSETSGTSGDALGTLLTAMEDFRWTGILAYGVSGCGKSLIAKAAANQFGAKAIRFDINSCKGSLVGESEKQIRAAMDILKAIGGERVFLIASMNQIASLPPELRRRFAAGTWYFDVPDEAGRNDIWRICAEQFGVEHDGYDADMLTGADIRDICQRAYELDCSTTEAARYHVPLCKAAPDAISESRADATNRYLDANFGGSYKDPTKTSTKYERSIQLND